MVEGLALADCHVSENPIREKNIQHALRHGIRLPLEGVIGRATVFWD
jgi:ABC-type antimicrobial peptide transport system permease subunit